MKPTSTTIAALAALVAALLSAVAAGSAVAALQAPPVNTSPPTISGTPTVGLTLTAGNGTWTNSPTSYQYQWLRCSTSGGSCVAVSNGTLKTYTLVGADAGHTMRVRVTAVNADGSTPAQSAATAIVQAAAVAPKNTSPPTISGTARVGQQLTASEGTWTGNPTSFAYQWQRCDADGSNCADVAGETSSTYSVQLIDLGFRLRVRVTAKTSKASATANSGVTAIVEPAAPITNHRPTLRIVSIRFLGARAYARFRICDDSFKNLSIIETDSKPGVLSYTRRFSTLIAPSPCGVYTRNWLPAARFRHGRYTITLRARDKSGLTSLPARRTFVR
jgi:hypothetical protein